MFSDELRIIIVVTVIIIIIENEQTLLKYAVMNIFCIIDYKQPS
jgi:hypothetical protein